MTLLWEALPLATLTGTTLYCAWRWLDSRAQYEWAVQGWRRAAARYDDQYHRRLEVETRLAEIDHARHLAAKKARAAQIAQQRAKRAETTYRLEVGR